MLYSYKLNVTEKHNYTYDKMINIEPGDDIFDHKSIF